MGLIGMWVGIGSPQISIPAEAVVPGSLDKDKDNKAEILALIGGGTIASLPLNNNDKTVYNEDGKQAGASSAKLNWK